jgi:hypothetical protein
VADFAGGGRAEQIDREDVVLRYMVTGSSRSPMPAQ